MTITVQPARNEYTANAGQTIFNYTFKIFEDTDLNVYITPSGQDANDSTDLTTSYTVDPIGIGDPAGGFITLTTPTNQNDLVTIVSNVPSERTIDYQNNGDFRPTVVNDDFDRVVSIAKKIEDTANRTALLQQSQQDPKPLLLPDPDAGKILRWRDDETGFENINIIETNPGAFFEEKQDLSAGQTVVVFSFVDVTIAAIYLSGEGVDRGRLILGEDFIIANNSTIQLNNSQPSGSVVTGVNNEPAGSSQTPPNSSIAIIQTGGGLLTAGASENQLRDSNTYQLPLASSVVNGGQITIALPDTYKAQTPTVERSGTDSIRDGTGTQNSVTYAGAARLVLTSDGVSEWSL